MLCCQTSHTPTHIHYSIIQVQPHGLLLFSRVSDEILWVHRYTYEHFLVDRRMKMVVTSHSSITISSMKVVRLVGHTYPLRGDKFSHSVESS
jgi:hypothetical protein